MKKESLQWVRSDHFAVRKSKCLLGSNGTIEVRIFQVPVVGTQAQIPYARVNHAKYMVTDNTAYIGNFLR